MFTLHVYTHTLERNLYWSSWQTVVSLYCLYCYLFYLFNNSAVITTIIKLLRQLGRVTATANVAIMLFNSKVANYAVKTLRWSCFVSNMARSPYFYKVWKIGVVANGTLIDTRIVSHFHLTNLCQKMTAVHFPSNALRSKIFKKTKGCLMKDSTVLE